MNMYPKQVVFPLFCSLVALAFTGCSTTHVHKLHMEVSESPDVHGPNTYQKPHSSMLRVTGKLNVNQKKKVRFFPEEALEEGEEVDWLYKMGGVDFTGSADFIYKADNAFFGGGVGYKDGIYHYFMFGDNRSIFEYGFFFGLHHQYGRLDYAGEHCDGNILDEKCTPFAERKNDFYSGVLVGAFGGLYFNNVFVNYTMSFTGPCPDVDGSSECISTVQSHYVTLGHRIGQIELSAGAIVTFVDSGFANFGFTGGLSFYVL